MKTTTRNTSGRDFHGLSSSALRAWAGRDFARRNRWRDALLLVALLCAREPAVLAGEVQFSMPEYLGVHWVDEFVSFSFNAARGACHPDSLSLRGPNGPLAVQLSEIDFWPAGEGVRSARVSFVVADLPPLARHTYTLSFGADPKAKTPVADLRATPQEDSVELSTSRFAVRLLQGEHPYPAPAAATEVPGPVAAMRLADGTWFGGSRLYGSRRITRYAASLAESGSVFARATVRYTYEDGTTMDLSARLIAGDSKVTWHMNVRSTVDTPEQPRRRSKKQKVTTDAAPPAPGDGWQLILSRDLDPLLAVLAPEHNDKFKWGHREFNQATGWIFTPGDVELQREPVGPITSLVPWEDWWNSFTQAQWTFKTARRGEVLRVAAIDPGVWVESAAPGTWLAWDTPNNRRKWIPLVHGNDGAISMEISAAAGERRWEVGGVGQSRPNADRRSVQGAHTVTMPGAQVGVGRRLNQVKDFVLNWPEPSASSHPQLFGTSKDAELARRTIAPAELTALRQGGRIRSTKEIRSKEFGQSDSDAVAAYLLSGSAEVASDTGVVERLSDRLALLGNYDLMRNIKFMTTLYDGVIDSGLVSGAQRNLLRAQMAYLGYLLADPSTWSVERGYCSSNLNMSISYILNLGLIACLLPDHPAAREWARPAIAMCNRWLDEKVGPAGEWPESVANYAQVSAIGLLLFAVAAKNAELHDFINDPRMKRLMLYLAKQYTPLDPRSGGERAGGLSLLPPSGRAGAGKARAIPGVMAKAIASSDPAYSRIQQWNWLRSGASVFTGASPAVAHLAVDRSLPVSPPDWGSDLFPQMGAILRQGVGTEGEWYVNFMMPTFSEDYMPSEYGSFAAIFAHGVPIGGAFAGGYAEKEELFMSRVHLARNRGTDEERRQSLYHKSQRKLSEFATLPRQDYVAADLTIETPIYRSLEAGAHDKMVPVPEWPPVPKTGQGPVDWRRQLLFVKGDQPADAGYFVLRDTVSGGQPTMWQMWMMSEKIGTPDQVQDVTRFLADKPGNRPMPARELKGDRFTAVGAYGVDTEFYIASPVATRRHTLRWGKTYDYSPLTGFAEYMDLVHLQMPADGSYYVVLFPRRREERVPVFQTLAEGKIIQIHGDFGTDHVFVAAREQSATAGGIAFLGTAASVQDRKGGLVLALGAQGEVGCREYRLSAGGAASLRVAPASLTVEAAGMGKVAITAPGAWVLEDQRPDITLAQEENRLILTLPAGVGPVKLRAR